MSSYRLKHGDYNVGWVCALPVELAAATAMLDEEHPGLPKGQCDSNAYTLGRISGHNVAVAVLPTGQIGTSSAATVVAQMRSSFELIRFGLMVGIGGGVPSPKHDIRLGDVVVSVPDRQCGGVIQYDFGKMEPGGQFKRTGSLNSPPKEVLTAINKLKAKHELKSDQPKHYLSATNNPKLTREYTYPGAEYDQLFPAKYSHKTHGSSTCENCDTSQLLQRPRRDNSDPVVHYGVIASGNSVIKDSVTRDRLGETDDVLCFEMEAAGLMNDLPFVVIRGICDYADSHKNERWQKYAAVTAATYAKELLSIIQHQAASSVDNQLLGGNRSQGQGWDADMLSVSNLQISHSNNTFSTIHNTASVFVKNKKYRDALKCYREILGGHVEALRNDPKAHSILSTIRDIASILLKGREYKDALDWYRMLLDIHMEVLGNEHDDTCLILTPILTTVRNTARLLLEKGNNQDAANWYHLLLDGNAKVFGSEHHDTCSTLSDIRKVASVYWENRKYQDALGWYRVLLDGCVMVFGKENRETLSTLLTIRGAPPELLKSGKYKDALEWYRESLDSHIKALGKEDAETRLVLFSIRDAARALLEGKKYKDALVWHRVSLVGHVKVFGKEDSETRSVSCAIQHVASVFRRNGMYKDAREWDNAAKSI